MSKDPAFGKLNGLEAFLENTIENELRDTTYINPSTLIESYSRLQLIYGFSRALCSENKLAKIPEAAVEALVKISNLERCFIAIFNEDNKLTPIAKYNIELGEKIEEWPVSRTLISRVVKDALPLLVVDTLKDKQFSAHHSMHLNQIRTLMCAPLGIKGAVKGIVYADSRHIADSFSYPDLLFLIAISQYVHLGLSSTKLLNSQKVLEQKPKEINSFSYEMLQLGLVGNSKKLQQTYQQLEKVSKKELPILIQGETGTGKELFAKAAHKLNPKRVNGPFVAINIAALSETIIESELFGHERGAFSGANQTRIGKLEQANEGTLFLDEVAEIPLKIQAKLLRVLETGEFERVGGTKKLYTNVRLISATNKSLEDFIKKGEFREDLYYRLKGATINIPALRERSEDIPLLVEYFLTKIATTKNFTPKALSSLQNYSWPGNIRQLLRLVEELDAICDSTEIDVLDLPSYINNIEKSSLVSANFLPLNELIAQVEYDYIQRALALAGGNNDKAIEMLGISRAKFFDRKKAYGL